MAGSRRGTTLPPLREPVTGKPRLDVTEIFRNKNLMLIGSTGFVGKIALSMLLHRYPDVGRIYCLVRPGAGNTADERFYKKAASSEVFDPVREAHGAGYEDILRSKIVAVPGDMLCRSRSGHTLIDAGGSNLPRRTGHQRRRSF